MARVIVIIAAVLVGGFFLMLLIGALTPQRTYRDIARDTAGDCVKAKGYGTWRGSSGLTLEQFCEMAGNIEALEQHKKEHPEQH